MRYDKVRYGDNQWGVIEMPDDANFPKLHVCTAYSEEEVDRYVKDAKELDRQNQKTTHRIRDPNWISKITSLNEIIATEIAKIPEMPNAKIVVTRDSTLEKAKGRFAHFHVDIRVLILATEHGQETRIPFDDIVLIEVLNPHGL